MTSISKVERSPTELFAEQYRLERDALNAAKAMCKAGEKGSSISADEYAGLVGKFYETMNGLMEFEAKKNK